VGAKDGVNDGETVFSIVGALLVLMVGLALGLIEGTTVEGTTVGPAV
jgi:hypothetical protein